ncbi:hypothetical protein DXT89_14180 [Agrobacterium vitis]|uniref:Uncharacterized protein n=1 Tax=Agrobacterium vitis TaxID=373 RepID=A0A7J4X5V2_AGRVI|nr:hypothetical protein DXT89_14180 [Agrobacterium vitis]
MSNKSPDTLLEEVNRFLELSRMGPSYFGKASVGNSELVKRLREGRPILTYTADRVRAFMAENKDRVTAGASEEAAQ